MFWHDDIADESEAATSSNLLEDLHGKTPATSGGEEWPSLVTAKGNEVKIAAANNALEILGHRREEGPTLCKTTKGRPPREVLYHCVVLFTSGYCAHRY